MPIINHKASQLTRLAGVLMATMLLCTPKMLPATELLIFYLEGCQPCIQFDKDVGKIYPKTEEAALAPLRHVPFGASPPNVELRGEINVAPTFVLIDNGQEMGRIEGYISDEAFWMSLTRLLNRSRQSR